MVGPGDVDEDLEPEVGEECAKYGEVHKCLIFEVKKPTHIIAFREASTVL